MIDVRIELNPKVCVRLHLFLNSEILTRDWCDSPHPVPVRLQPVRDPPRVPGLLHGLVSLNSNLKLNFMHWNNFEIGYIFKRENFELRMDWIGT